MEEEEKEVSWNVPTSPPEDLDALLGEHLGQLQKLTRQTLFYAHSHGTFDRIFEATKIAGGLMSVSVKIARVLKTAVNSKTVRGVRPRKDPQD
jgi:hypothetical protein